MMNNQSKEKKNDTYQVFIMGNQGTGKSTLCNSLLGRKFFKSGISEDGTGVTKKYKFYDTKHGF